MDRSGLSRRGFLKALGVTAGAAAGARILGPFVPAASAAEEPASVVIVHHMGGYNALFASAAPLQGKFGVTATNFTALGNGVSMDNTLADALSPFAKTHVATIGVAHGRSAHPDARGAIWANAGKCFGHELASAMGGTGSNKALFAGQQDIDERPRAAVSGVAFENVTDMRSYLDAIGANGPGPRDPDRARMLAALRGADAMSKHALDANPRALMGMRQGFAAAVETLSQPPASFDLAELQTAYGLGATSRVATFASKMAAAELFVRTGANVVTLVDGGWDTHGDINGTRVRNQMTENAAALRAFVARMITEASTRNVVLCLLGDFARSLPGSDHQPNLSATVIGKRVKRGSTGNVNGSVVLGPGTPGTKELWAYLAAAAGVTSTPFGADPHRLVV